MPHRTLGKTTAWWLILAISLNACTGAILREATEPLPPGHASPPATTGLLATLAERVRREHGDEHSAFHLLDRSDDSLTWRLALIDSAVSSLDIQTYLWYPDNAGKLVLDRAIRAADRGVRVRLIVDDLLTIGLDKVNYALQTHPNIELRLFNPWERRSTLARAGQMIAQMERLNTRMHDKLLIADGRAAVVGGRNIGDHYFGLSPAYNFHDLDVLGFGHIAEQSGGMFDSFWNSGWVASAGQIDTRSNPESARPGLEQMREVIATTEVLSAFARLPRDWTSDFELLWPDLHAGTSHLIYDEATADAIEQNVAGALFDLMGMAQHELLITNAYIIPGQPAIEFLEQLTGRGVRVRILTNSLASHDVPAVNSHYKGWRDDILRAGAELFELRSDAAIQSLVDVPPTEGAFTGLHTKAFVVDRRWSFIGSMNFDPRSVNINTEAGAFIDSPGLAEELARLMERDMAPENAWQVFLDDAGKPYWVHDEERLDRQPARDGTQRIMDVLFRMFPKDQY